MLDFSAVTLLNAPNLKHLLTHSYSRLCDYVYGTVLLWRDMWPLEAAVHDDMVFLRIEISEGQTAYMLPVAEDLEHALGILDSFCPGGKLFINVPYGEIETLKQRYKKIDIEAIASGGDYIYDAESMASLKGRKLHGQRNHCNYFERTWVHSLEKVTVANVCDVKEFIARKAVAGSSALFLEGNRKTLEALDNLDVYGFSAMALYADGKVVGFTLGTLLGDTLYVTIEQADRDYRGAYPKLASGFVAEALKVCPELAFVNREDDLGDEGLRRAKMSWNPCEIIERFAVTVE